MAIILDADVIIRGEKGEFDLFGWLSRQPREHFELAAITIAELWHGVERATGKRRSVREAYLETVTSLLPIIPYTEQTGHIHARIWADLEKKGLLIGGYDIIVAATALERDSAVATFNQRHFQSVKGLKVILPA
ncbi:MAG: PIN domain-containing protein [Verrucomicrobiota bacterium]